MKNIVQIILIILPLSLFAQDSLQTNTSIGLSFRAYAPATGATLNEDPVFEFNKSFSKRDFTISFTKSIDLVDGTSKGNYTFVNGKYQLVKKEHINLWLSLGLAQFDVNFLPSGNPFTFIQTGVSTQRNNMTFGLRTLVLFEVSSDIQLTYVLRPFVGYNTKKGAKLRSELWLSNDHWILGFGCQSPKIKLSHGSLKFSGQWNYQKNWLDNEHKGILNIGCSYTFE